MSGRRRHDWRCAGGAGSWEVWDCQRCGHWEFPTPFGFMWSDVARFLHRRWTCPEEAS